MRRLSRVSNTLFAPRTRFPNLQFCCRRSLVNYRGFAEFKSEQTSSGTTAQTSWSPHIRDQDTEEWLQHWPTRRNNPKHHLFTQGITVDDAEYLDARLDIFSEKYGIDLVICCGTYVPLTFKVGESDKNGRDAHEAANSLMCHIGVGHVDYSNGILLFIAADDSQVGISRGAGLHSLISRAWLDEEWLKDLAISQDLTSSRGITTAIDRFEEHVCSLLDNGVAKKVHTQEGMPVLIAADENPPREYYFEVVCIFTAFFIATIGMAVYDGRKEARQRQYLCQALNDAEDVFQSRYEEYVREAGKSPRNGLHEEQLKHAYQHFHERLRILESVYPLQFRRLVLLLDRSLSPQIVFNGEATTTAIDSASIAPGSTLCLRFDSISFPLFRWYMTERESYEKRWKRWLESHDPNLLFERSLLRGCPDEIHGIPSADLLGDVFGGHPTHGD